MVDVEYGYVGNGKRVHIVRADSTTYCERTISKRVPDPAAVDPEEVCKTCMQRREEVVSPEEDGHPQGQGMAEVAADPTPDPAGAAEEAVAAEGAGQPEDDKEETAAPSAGAGAPAAAQGSWERMQALCEERLGSLCAPALAAAVLVVLIGAVLAAGLLTVVVVLAVVVGGVYGYLHLTGQEERWSRLMSAAARLLSDVRQWVRGLLR
ncbi:MAG: hypothetical protein ACLFRB_04615 [Thiohalorhabdus sp.]|uniref:hypothetical protein n=1 Tax=Thiohalorhabdus sp. TaxID=3094134 RepID=UPI0039813FA2